jgi:hypothetical protein
MLLFRSEEHASRWRSTHATPASTLLTLDQAARLAHAWYVNKLAPDWRRHTVEQAEQLFWELGLDAEFWRLR